MKIGIDIRILQNDHKYRGIGEVARQTLDKVVPRLARDGHEVVFFRFDDNQDIKKIISLPKNLIYREVGLGADPVYNKRLRRQKIKDTIRSLYLNPIPKASQCDKFIQFDYTLGVPLGTKTVLVKHDIIPYVFWSKYFTSPMTHFKNKAARTTLRTILYNYSYKRILKRSLRNAQQVVCVSEHTRQDLHKYFGAPLRKMVTIHLGVGGDNLVKGEVDKAVLPTKSYLIFIGAADARRSVDDLIAAYNNLRADGHDLQLVLAGENFKSDSYIKKILPTDISKSILGSSYSGDILKVGYINDATKNHLLENALAFVFPTRYEGFGIPILEAMDSMCPVITYKVSSIPEVAGKHAIYAKDWMGLYSGVKKVLSMSESRKRKWLKNAHDHAQSFTWSKTAERLYSLLVK